MFKFHTEEISGFFALNNKKKHLVSLDTSLRGKTHTVNTKN